MKARLAIVPLALAGAVGIASVSSAGTHAAATPRCDVNDEHYTYYPTEGAAGTMFDQFRIRHRGKRPRCTLRGYPSIELLGKHVIPEFAAS